ncbi:hypothetical protein [Granulicoccus sp. GXG6511]|uniref:hypothetical protein n=1 Tax=Granulicoccus sp. GXG6511 TaxID=3381351 RepID=UPI003D7E8DFE
MRKPLKSLAAATGAAFILAAGAATTAYAAPANPDGTTAGAEAVLHTVEDGDVAPYWTDMMVTAPGNAGTRTQTSPWSCGKLRMDGWADTASAGQWRVAVGASYALPVGTNFVLLAEGEGWSVAPFEEFERFGTPGANVSVADMAAPEDGSHPAYTWIADQDSVDVTYFPAEEGGPSAILVQLTEGMAANEYFNLAFTTAIDPAHSADAPVTLRNLVTTNVTCETPEPEPTPTPTPTPTPEPSIPTTGPTPDVTHKPAKPPVKHVNSGGVETGASGIAAMALGATALGGLALYGRNRAKK